MRASFTDFNPVNGGGRVSLTATCELLRAVSREPTHSYANGQCGAPDSHCLFPTRTVRDRSRHGVNFALAGAAAAANRRRMERANSYPLKRSIGT